MEGTGWTTRFWKERGGESGVVIGRENIGCGVGREGFGTSLAASALPG